MIHAASGHCECCQDYRPPPERVKAVSTTWPWDHGKLTPRQCAEHLVTLGATEVCIRGPVYFTPLQPEHLAPIAQAFHAELVALATERGIDVSLWPVVSLYNPELMADRIAEYCEHYDPEQVYLDAERQWVTKYIANTTRFLDRLAAHRAAGRIRCPVGLGSYRRANVHPEMRWRTWIQHRGPDGRYTIDFLAHQLYPIGWYAPAAYAQQALLDVRSHDDEVARAGRPPMDWIPWVPAFSEHGWTPSGEGVRSLVGALEGALGPRLLGLNWWSLDQDLVRRGMEVNPPLVGVYSFIKGEV